MTRFVKVHGPTLLCAILIFIFSSIQFIEVPDMGFSFQDKLAHVLEFGIFGFFLQRSFHHLSGGRFKGYLLAFAIGTAYGGLDEIHQSFVEGREAGFMDFLADAIGIVLSQITFWIRRRIKLF